MQDFSFYLNKHLNFLVIFTTTFTSTTKFELIALQLDYPSSLIHFIKYNCNKYKGSEFITVGNKVKQYG